MRLMGSRGRGRRPRSRRSRREQDPGVRAVLTSWIFEQTHPDARRRSRVILVRRSWHLRAPRAEICTSELFRQCGLDRLASLSLEPLRSGQGPAPKGGCKCRDSDEDCDVSETKPTPSSTLNDYSQPNCALVMVVDIQLQSTLLVVQTRGDEGATDAGHPAPDSKAAENETACLRVRSCAGREYPTPLTPERGRRTGHISRYRTPDGADTRERSFATEPVSSSNLNASEEPTCRTE